MVTIIIPIYKEKPTALEVVSITQTFRVLDRYDIVLYILKHLIYPTIEKSIQEHNLSVLQNVILMVFMGTIS